MKKFISIRWKLVSTYLLLVLITLIIINIFISQTILKIYINQKRNDSFAKANILSNRVRHHLFTDRMNESFMDNTILDYSQEIKARIIIVDKKNVVKADSNKNFIGEIFKHDEIRKALQGRNNSQIYKFKPTGHVMYVAVPIVLHDEIIGATLISMSINYIYDEVNHITGKLNLISLCSIFVTSIIGSVFAGLLFKPLNEFKRVIDKIAQGDLRERVKINSNDEFKDMSDAFNIMILKLDQVDEQRKDFVANVSHELKTPLSSIKILSQSLLSQDEGNIEIYKEFLKDIDSEVDRLNNIINDLLILVNIDKKKLNIDYKTTYINFLLEKIILRLKPLAEEKSIKLKLKMNQKVQIKVDNQKIQQAIINIVENAIKYTQQGGMIKVRLYTSGKFVVIEISDNGIGISEKHLPYIFERFYRVDKARSRSTGGTGLGLSIAWQIVSLHGGFIDVKSKLGKGTIFYIKLPIKN